MGKQQRGAEAHREPKTILISSIFQPSGTTLLTCVEEEDPAGEVGRPRFEVMLPAAMPSGMCSSQYFPFAALPLRPFLLQPVTEQGAVATIFAPATRRDTRP